MTDAPLALARRMFGRSRPWLAVPFWADGGPGGRHVLAALPDRVERVSVAELSTRELSQWLRQRLLATDDPNLLHVVLLAYDAGRNLEVVDETAMSGPAVPDVVVARYRAHWVIEGDGEASLVGEVDARQELQRWLQTSPLEPPKSLSTGLGTGVGSSLSRERYDAAVADILRGIAAGDFYEVNLARRLLLDFDAASTPALYEQLRARTRAPYGALWALDEHTWMASGSPECLFTWDPATRQVHSFPIKGTRPRSQDVVVDKKLASELSASVKDRAEHVMIVDLVRNDLGRIAEPGTVTVDGLFGVHSFRTVHHMITDVSARAQAGKDVVDVVAALFPGGSITGAPKIAAMNAIERLEGVRRGWYCGSLGVIDRGGRATFNILIRTAVAAQGQLSYHTGGAIVADSDAGEEWAETVTKADAFVEAVGSLPR